MSKSFVDKMREKAEAAEAWSNLAAASRDLVELFSPNAPLSAEQWKAFHTFVAALQRVET